MTINPDDTWSFEMIQNGDVEAVRLRAIEEPAYLTSRDFEENTPLLTAISFEDLEIVKVLLSQGADPNVEVDDGFTCLITACDTCDDSAGDATSVAEAVAIVVALIEAGADIHATGANGWAPLHMASANGHAAVVQALLDAGARIDQRADADGETPLIAAARSGNAATVQILLDGGADPSLRDFALEDTPLRAAQASAAGPKQEEYEGLKQLSSEIDVVEAMSEMFEEMDLPPEQLAMLKQKIENMDVAETYLQNAEELAGSGDYDEVIRILSEHAKK